MAIITNNNKESQFNLFVGNEDYLNYDKGWSDTDGAKADARLVQKYFKLVLCLLFYKQ